MVLPLSLTELSGEIVCHFQHAAEGHITQQGNHLKKKYISKLKPTDHKERATTQKTTELIINTVRSCVSLNLLQ